MAKTFEAQIRDSGNGISFEITIPKAILEYESLKEGDTIEVSITKKQ